MRVLVVRRLVRVRIHSGGRDVDHSCHQGVGCSMEELVMGRVAVSRAWSRWRRVFIRRRTWGDGEERMMRDDGCTLLSRLASSTGWR
jgi:hypothetical protein